MALTVNIRVFNADAILTVSAGIALRPGRACVAGITLGTTRVAKQNRYVGVAVCNVQIAVCIQRHIRNP